MRKLKTDPAAFEAAANHISSVVPDDETVADAVVHTFTAAEFETATSRVGGEEITLRRIVLTTEWEVAPK